MTQELLSCKFGPAILIYRIGSVGLDVGSIQPPIKNEIRADMQEPSVSLFYESTETPYRFCVDLMRQLSFALGTIDVGISCAVDDYLRIIESFF